MYEKHYATWLTIMCDSAMRLLRNKDHSLSAAGSDPDAHITTSLSIFNIPALVIREDWLTTFSTVASAFFSSPFAKTKIVLCCMPIQYACLQRPVAHSCLLLQMKCVVTKCFFCVFHKRT